MIWLDGALVKWLVLEGRLAYAQFLIGNASDLQGSLGPGVLNHSFFSTQEHSFRFTSKDTPHLCETWMLEMVMV